MKLKEEEEIVKIAIRMQFLKVTESAFSGFYLKCQL